MADRLRRREIDHQLECCWLHDGQLGSLGVFETPGANSPQPVGLMSYEPSLQNARRQITITRNCAARREPLSA
jgi:hypothetical protein